MVGTLLSILDNVWLRMTVASRIQCADWDINVFCDGGTSLIEKIKELLRKAI